MVLNMMRFRRLQNSYMDKLTHDQRQHGSKGGNPASSYGRMASHAASSDT